ncbi:MAG: 2,3,4,5-tetrahydropyridine-2,6-dicarboxylate N-succinyltransferase [Proteobacteria bacterium]|nr:2,3,4,5-tetrahydropyridine-2,6-dicarboxylate N-succinyltransferase [Pseudomonadota bacterium]
MLEQTKNQLISHLNGTHIKQGTDLKTILNDFYKFLDSGFISCVEKGEDGSWKVNQWVKESILLYFKEASLNVLQNYSFDKIPLKTNNWNEQDFLKAGFRSVPGAIIRKGAYIAPSVVVMPSFINVGARVLEKTMVDSGVTVGSCAYIGKNVHLSSNVVIGGVLEPVQALPVIVEDHCFIGANSSILEGMIIEEGAVISSGVNLTASTKIIDRETGNVLYGRVPSYSVVVSGTYPSSNGIALSCAVIVKRVDEKTRSKTKINDLLRDF